jgi:hypothetical protein
MRPKGIPLNYVEDKYGGWTHPARLVGSVLSTKPQPNPVPALDQKSKVRRGGTRRVALVITIIRVGKAMLDDDNLSSSFKGVRDAIAKSFGIDDRDPRVKWEYGQTQTRGPTGSIVKIARV